MAKRSGTVGEAMTRAMLFFLSEQRGESGLRNPQALPGPRGKHVPRAYGISPRVAYLYHVPCPSISRALPPACAYLNTLNLMALPNDPDLRSESIPWEWYWIFLRDVSIPHDAPTPPTSARQTQGAFGDVSWLRVRYVAGKSSAR